MAHPSAARAEIYAVWRNQEDVPSGGNKQAQETKERQWKVARSLLVVVYTTESGDEGGRRCGRAEPKWLGSRRGLHGRGTGAVLRRSVNGTAVRVYGDQRRRGKDDGFQCLDRGIVVGTRRETRDER